MAMRSSILIVSRPMVKWYLGLNGRILIGFVASQSKMGSGSIWLYASEGVGVEEALYPSSCRDDAT